MPLIRDKAPENRLRFLVIEDVQADYPIRKMKHLKNHQVCRSVVEYVPKDGEYDAAQVDGERDPPDVLLMQLLLEVLEHDEPHGQPSQGAHQVRRVAHRRPRLFVRVPIPHRKPNVCAC